MFAIILYHAFLKYAIDLCNFCIFCFLEICKNCTFYILQNMQNFLILEFIKRLFFLSQAPTE